MKRWMKILAVVLAAVVLVTGGLFAWKGGEWFGEKAAAEVYDFPAGDPVRFDPPDATLPPVQGYVPEPADFALDEATGLEFVKGILTVYFEREASQAQRQAAFEAVAGTVVGKAERFGKWELQVQGQGDTLAELEALCAALKAMPGVAAAMPDHVVDLAQQGSTNDPWSSNASWFWWAKAIRLPEAWDYNDVITQTVTVGEVDGGINTAHEELAGIAEMLTNVSVTDYINAGGAGLDNPPKVSHSYTPVALQHSTSIASIMAGKAGNQKGLAGILQNAKVYGFDYRTADGPAKRETINTILDGVAAVVEQGASAVNISTGYLSAVQTVGAGAALQKSDATATATFLAQMIRFGYGRVVVVQSAGNYRTDAIRNGLFACVTASNCGLDAKTAEMVMKRILIVGASDKNNVQTSDSATGAQVSLYAPGEAIYSAGLGSSEYVLASGGSYAAPQVTAAAAWMLAANDALDGGQVGALLKLEAVSPLQVKDYESGSYYRMLDLRRALEAAYPETLLAKEGAAFTVDNESAVVLLAEGTAPAALDDMVTAWGGSYVRDRANDGAYLRTGQQAAVLSPLGTQKLYTLAVKGDLSGDGRVNAVDAQLLRQKLDAPAFDLGLSAALYQAAADYNADGSIDEADAQAMFDRGMA